MSAGSHHPRADRRTGGRSMETKGRVATPIGSHSEGAVSPPNSAASSRSISHIARPKLRKT